MMPLLPPSWRLARSSLAGRRGRAALLVAAVGLSSSFIVAISCAIASAQASLESQLVQTLGAATARIVHTAGGRFDESALRTVRAWPEVEVAAGRLAAPITLIHADRRLNPATGQLFRQTPTALGIDLAADRTLKPLQLLDGRDIRDPHEIVLDPMTASGLHAKPGDRLLVQRFGEEIELTVVGLYQRHALGTLQRAEVQLARDMLAQAANRQGQLTGVAIKTRAGIDVSAFCDRHAHELPRTLQLEPADLVRAGFDRRLMVSRLGTTFAAVLACMSAAFIILTGLTTGVTELQREMAVMRCVGARRGQLFAAQLWIGGVIGGLGAIIGVPLGILLAWALVRRHAIVIPDGLRISTQGLGLSMAGAILAGLLGAMYPAWQAARISPLAALAAPSRVTRPRHIAWCVIAAALCAATQLALLTLPEPQGRFWAWIIAGLPLLLIGYFLLAVPLTLLVATIAGPLIGRGLALPMHMLPRSIRATPFRHGLTAGALMLGVALLVGTWSTGSSLLDDWLGRIRFADGFAFRTIGISPVSQRAIAALPFVEGVCPIGYLQVQVVDRQVFGVRGLAPPNVTLFGFDPDAFFAMNAVQWLRGDPASAIERLKRGDAILVAEQFLKARDIGAGDRLTLAAGRVRHEFEIVGVIESAGLDIITNLFGIRSAYGDFAISGVFADFATVGRVFDNHDAHALQINFSGDMDERAISAAIAEVAPDVRFRSGKWIKQVINNIAVTVLSLYTAVAVAALVIACLGVANVIIANIHGRRFEYGVLRAVGAGRGLLARLILGEAVVLALAGSLTGALLGLHIAAVSTMHYRDLLGLSLRVQIPWAALVGGVLVVLVLTASAALLPALRLMRTAPRVLLAAGRGG